MSETGVKATHTRAGPAISVARGGSLAHGARAGGFVRWDAFLTTDITKNWVTVLAKKHKQGKSANLAAMMGALDRINAAAASHPLPGCPLCFSWKLALARGRMQAVVKQVRREDADVFQPLHLALSLHVGRRRGCPGTHWFTDALPEFYFLSINKYDNESGQIFVPKDLWWTKVHIERSPGQRLCCAVERRLPRAGVRLVHAPAEVFLLGVVRVGACDVV